MALLNYASAIGKQRQNPRPPDKFTEPWIPSGVFGGRDQLSFPYPQTQLDVPPPPLGAVHPESLTPPLCSKEELIYLRVQLERLFNHVWGNESMLTGRGSTTSRALSTTCSPSQLLGPAPQKPPPLMSLLLQPPPGSRPPPQQPRFRHGLPQPRKKRRLIGHIEREYRARVRLLVNRHKANRIPLPAKCSIVEVEGDIRESPETYKAHACAADLGCYAGLAAGVVQDVGRPEGLTAPPKVGDVLAKVGNDDLIWLFLVTKEKSWHKPRHNFNKFVRDVQFSIEQLARYIIAHDIKEIAIPHLCSGLDRLNWLYIRDLIRHNLQDVEVKVVVYHLPRPPPPITEDFDLPRPQPPVTEDYEMPPETDLQPDQALAPEEREVVLENQSPTVSSLDARIEEKQQEQEKQQEKQQEQDEHWAELPHPMTTRSGKKYQRKRVTSKVSSLLPPPPPAQSSRAPPQWCRPVAHNEENIDPDSSNETAAKTLEMDNPLIQNNPF
jgi:hypothetical protein